MVFFFKQKTAYEIYQCDWSSDVCSSDLVSAAIPPGNERLYLPLVAQAGSPAIQLANGGFEDGRTIWRTFSTHDNAIIRAGTAVSPHQGDWLAQLGGADDETAFIEQQVTVPAAAPYLHFWAWFKKLATSFTNFDNEWQKELMV